MSEIWKDIIGYAGYYQASNLGRIRSLNRKVKHYRGGILNRKGIILKQGLDVYGYPQVLLSKNGKSKNHKVHRLVLSAFKANIRNKPTINHKDGIKKNNNINNLEWATRSENQLHAYKKGLQVSLLKGKTGDQNPFSKKVFQFNIDGTKVNSFGSVREAERITGINRCGIMNVCTKRGYYKTAGGFKWKYA